MFAATGTTTVKLENSNPVISRQNAEIRTANFLHKMGTYNKAVSSQDHCYLQVHLYKSSGTHAYA